MDQTSQISIPLPLSFDTRIYIHLTVRAKSILLFLTTGPAEERPPPPPLGSFVYALPNRFDSSQPLSTALTTVESSLDFTTRLAKLLARKTQLPVYLGNSASFSAVGLGGGTVEEIMEAFKNIADVILSRLEAIVPSSSPAVDGTLGGS
ncbi:hypothetical protein VTK73DRAFT_504 [Phialemonium thermophilum]|uniref:Uncharacterized protein n=1 Tax=Phialemonium thermophilum TaxID=223376 RepID=A0ABR3Y539_9PEZI